MLTARSRIHTLRYVHTCSKTGMVSLTQNCQISHLTNVKTIYLTSQTRYRTKIKFTPNVPHFKSTKRVLNAQKVQFDSKHNANRP